MAGFLLPFYLPRGASHLRQGGLFARRRKSRRYNLILFGHKITILSQHKMSLGRFQLFQRCADFGVGGLGGFALFFFFSNDFGGSAGDEVFVIELS